MGVRNPLRTASVSGVVFFWLISPAYSIFSCWIGPADHLRHEFAEVFAEQKIRLQFLELLGVQRRQVDGVADGAGQEIIAQRFREFLRHFHLGFFRGGAQMRGDDDVRQRQERIILGRRLRLEDVDRRAFDVAALDRLGQGLLVDDAAARAVDQAHAGLKFLRAFRR